VNPLELISLVGFAVVLVLLLWRPQLGIAAFVMYYPLNDHVPRLPIPGFNAESLLFGIMGALTLLRFGARVPPLRYTGTLFGVVLVMAMAWGMTAAQVSVEQYGPGAWDFFQVLKSTLFPTLLFFFGYWWYPDPASRRRLMEVVSLTLALTALAGIADWIAPFSRDGLEARRATGVFPAANVFGGTLAAWSLIPLYLVRQPDIPQLRRLLHMCAYALGLLALALSLSRSGWLGLIAGHTVFFLYVNRGLLLAGVVAMVLLVTVGYAAVPDLIRDRIDETFQTRNRVFWGGGAERFGSGADRIVYYQIGAEMFMDSPIWGHGTNAFLLNTPKYGAKYGLLANKAPHSLVVKIATEAGSIGLAIFAWLALTVMLVSHRVWRRSSEDRGLGVLLFGGFVSIGVTSLFQPTFFSHLLGGYFWLLFGLVAHAEVDVRVAASERRAAISPFTRLQAAPASLAVGFPRS
jgi:O-antigen ligase